MNKVQVILQARLDSSRLPGKAMLLLGGEPMVFRVMEALRRIPSGGRTLACPEDCASVFAPLAARAGFTLFAGPKDDVLSRYCQAARAAGLDNGDYIIRATGDNPFVNAEAAASICREALSLHADYAAYAGLPYGAGVEAVRAGALFRAEIEAKTDAEREHVCPYLYAHSEFFLLHRPLAPLHWQNPSLRLTVDTREDYENAVARWESGGAK